MNIVITGANRGLGLEIAAEAAARGHRVLAGVRAKGQGDERLLRLAERHEGAVEIIALDMADEEGIRLAAGELQRRGVQVDGVVNNAAILVGRGTALEELDLGEVTQTLDINLLGPMRVAKHLLPLMAAGGGPGGGAAGVIVNVSSEGGSITHAYGGDYAYALSKTALNMFSQQLSRYVAERGIRVYAVHPGWMKTDMGGEQAPTDPAESARGIVDLLERKRSYDGPFVFIDAKAGPMTI